MAKQILINSKFMNQNSYFWSILTNEQKLTISNYINKKEIFNTNKYPQKTIKYVFYIFDKNYNPYLISLNDICKKNNDECKLIFENIRELN